MRAKDNKYIWVKN